MSASAHTASPRPKHAHSVTFTYNLSCICQALMRFCCQCSHTNVRCGCWSQLRKAEQIHIQFLPGAILGALSEVRSAMLCLQNLAACQWQCHAGQAQVMCMCDHKTTRWATDLLHGTGACHHR